MQDIHTYVVYGSFPLFELRKTLKLAEAKSKRMKKFLEVQIQLRKLQSSTYLQTLFGESAQDDDDKIK